MSNKLSINRATAPQFTLSFHLVRISVFSLAFIAVLGLLAVSAVGQQRRQSASQLVQQGGKDAAVVVFGAGRDLITDGEWAKAQEKFDQYVTAYPNEKNIDGALYWKAYAEQKLAKYDLCRATVRRLVEKYPNSNWVNDARLLVAQQPGRSPRAVSVDPSGTYVDDELFRRRVAGAASNADVVGFPPQLTGPVALPPPAMAAPSTALTVDNLAGSASDDSDDPCEFKIVVLQALFQTDTQRGIVVASDWLRPGSTQTARCKGAALSLLGRNGGKSATPVILGFAKSEPDIKLRARAIQALGATNDDSVVDSLRDFALSSQDSEIVEASVYALSRHTGDRAIAVLSDIATSGKVVSQRKQAISAIAQRPGEPAVDALLRIYDTDQTFEIRRSVIAGFGNRKSERAGNKLFDIARTSDNIELRKAAISAISRRGGDKAVDFLLSLYDAEKNEEIKDQILSALGMGAILYAPLGTTAGQGIRPGAVGNRRVEDPRVIDKLIQIARDPQAPMERRKRAIGMLSRSSDPKVLSFLETLLK